VAALQRNLKALGTFGYQISAGNDVYRRYIPHTRPGARQLGGEPEVDRLRSALAKHFPSSDEHYANS
jgi:hypothetical protein